MCSTHTGHLIIKSRHRMTGIIRRIFLSLCTLLALGVAVLAVRSFWRADEIGYYTYKPTSRCQGRRGLTAAN